MSDELVPIRNFSSAAEAAPIKAQLDSNGIRSVVEGGVSNDALWDTVSLGVRLFVAKMDVERALQLLDSENDAAPSEPWDCPACREHIEAGFDLCWSCGASRFDDARTAVKPAEPATELNEDRCPMCGERLIEAAEMCANCGEPLTEDVPADPNDNPDVQEENPSIQEMEASLARAWRSSILAMVFCPPLLLIISMTELARYHTLRRDLNQPTNWRARAIVYILWIEIMLMFVIPIAIGYFAGP